jgi:hypothetical protein
MSADPAVPAPTRSHPAVVLVWAGVAAWTLGFVQHRLWEQLPGGRVAESIAVAALVSLMAWPLVHWRRWPWAPALAAVWLAAGLLAGGLPASLAVVLVIAAACALGGLVSGSRRPLFAMLVGLSLIATIAGWLLPLPVHHWWVYLPLLAGIVAWRRRHLRLQARTCVGTLHRAIAASPRAATVAVLALGTASSAAWLPTMQYDDLAYHLGLPWQLMLHGRYTLDPTHQVWALAPWAGDVLQAIPQVLSRTEARGPLNIAWLLATAAALWRLGGVTGLGPDLRWGVLALYASMPMTAALLGGMQTESPATAVMAALALLVLGGGRGMSGTRQLATGAVLFGMLFALKPVHGLASLPLVLIAAFHWRLRKRPRPAALAAAAALWAVVALPSYAYAWPIAGNPVLPLFNDVFGSPYFAPVRFVDERWATGLELDMLWTLTFATDAWLEAWPGGAGFVQVLLAGAWLLALLLPRTRSLAVAGAAAIVIPVVLVQYARYLHPGLVLLGPALAGALQHWLPMRQALAVLALACVTNFAYQANAHWMLRTGAVKWSVLALGRDDPLFERYAPERLVAARIRDSSAAGNVLFLHEPAHAELADRGRSVSWYAPAVNAAAAAAERDRTGQGWRALLRELEIGEVVLRPNALTPPQRAGLALAGAGRTARFGKAEWWRIPCPGERCAHAAAGGEIP